MKLRNPSVKANFKAWYHFITGQCHVFDMTRRLVSPVCKKNTYSAPWNCVYFDENGLSWCDNTNREHIILPFENLSVESKEKIYASMEEYDFYYDHQKALERLLTVFRYHLT